MSAGLKVCFPELSSGLSEFLRITLFRCHPGFDELEAFDTGFVHCADVCGAYQTGGQDALAHCRRNQAKLAELSSIIQETLNVNGAMLVKISTRER